MKIAFPINRGEKIARHVSFCPSFLMIETETGEREIVDNPMKIEGAAVDLKKDKSEGRRLGTGRIISQLFAEKEVDLYVYLEADANFLLHLQNVGIYVYESQEKVIEVALKTVEVNLKEFFNFAQRGGQGFRRRANRNRGFGHGRRRAHGEERGFGRGARMTQQTGRGFGRRYLSEV